MVSWFFYAITFALSPGIMIVGLVAIMAIIRFNMTGEAAPISGAMAMVNWFWFRCWLRYAIAFARMVGILIIGHIAILAIVPFDITGRVLPKRRAMAIVSWFRHAITFALSILVVIVGHVGFCTIVMHYVTF